MKASRWTELNATRLAVLAVCHASALVCFLFIYPQAIRSAILLLFNMLIVGAYVLAAWGVGRRILSRFPAASASGSEKTMLAISLGLSLWVLVLFVLGHTGLLYPAVLLAFLAGGLFTCVRPLAAGAPAFFLRMRAWTAPLDPVPALLLVTGLITAFSVMLATLVPEIFYDSLYYHDGFARLYLMRHRIAVFPHAVHNSIPANIDLLYLPLLCFGGGTAVKFGHFAFWIGTLAWIFLGGRRFFDPLAGIGGAVLFAGLPGIGNMAGMGTADMGVTFFAMGAAHALSMWVFSDAGRGSLIASAALLGITLGSKYSALPLGVVLGAGVLIAAWRRYRPSWSAVSSILLFAAVALAIGSPWYLRNLAVHGNPFYPVFEPSGTPGGIAYENLRRDSSYPIRSLRGVLTTPLKMVTTPQAFGAGAASGAGLPLLAIALGWGLFRRGYARWASIGVVGLYLLWTQTNPIGRFLYPAISLASVLGGGLLLQRRFGQLRRSIGTLCVVLVAGIGVYQLFQFYRSFYGGILEYLRSSGSPMAYVQSRIPPMAAAEWVARNTEPIGTKLLFAGETRFFYYGRDCEPTAACNRHFLVDLISPSTTPAALQAELVRRGFTHLVLNPMELVQLNTAYDYCRFTLQQWKCLEQMLAGCRILYRGGGVIVYDLDGAPSEATPQTAPGTGFAGVDYRLM